MATDPLAAKTGQIPRGRRVHPRARVALPAVLETMEGTKKVKLRNLSSAGAMVETPRTPNVGRDLVLKCSDIDALGIVVWEDGDRCGIEFYDRIGPDEVVRQRQLSDAHVEQQRLNHHPEVIRAAERWSLGKS